jgi:diguanylate cyclase (GGDEF)-like protein
MAHARRSGGRVAVMFLDLDRFKHVNDSLGHAAGNQLLAAVARRLRASLGGDATVARLGGDEFAVLLPALDDVARAAGVAGAVLAAFARPFRAGRRELFVSPSIGVALWPDHGPDLDTLLKHADIAMYRAKAAGRNTFCVYDPAMSAGIRERLDLESRLHVAIEREELVLHYQPKVDLRTGRIVGVEALARWHHPTAGLLDPGRFIPLAEETGLIVALGEWVLAEACAQAVRWQAAGLPPLVVAVNVSARQFQHQRVPDVTAAILRATGLAPWLLEFEVTESLALEDPDRTAAMLTDLKEMGVRCAIDDFGTGYSGLSYLERFPIDALKIDKSFVQSIRPGRGAPIVTAVVALAHSLGLRVVAEGVETRAQLDYLREVGCDEMQGYLFSGPLEAAAVARVLAVERALPHNLRPTAPETLLARLSEISAAAPRRRP